MKRRYLAIPFVLIATVLLVIVQIASNRITSPERRRLQDYHYAILAEPAEHGLVLSSHTASNGTPYLICRPGIQASQKGRTLKKQLLNRGYPDFATKDTALLLLHGHGGRKEDHLPIAERFCAAGFICLLPDLPAHGESPHPTATFGQTEVPLLLDLLDELDQDPDLPDQISLFGLSQGGAIAIQLAGEHPTRFQALASLSSFANLQEILTRTAKKQSPLHASLLPAVTLNLKLSRHFSPAEIAPESSAQHITIPSFFVHGADDPFIPAEHAQRLYQNLPSNHKQLRLIPEGNHNNILIAGHQLYADLTAFFLEAHTAASLERSQTARMMNKRR